MLTRRNLAMLPLAALAGIPVVSTGSKILPEGRARMVAYIARVTKKTGWIPEYAVMGFGTWAKLAEDFKPSELQDFDDLGRPKSGRATLDIAGVPFYAEPDVDEGSVWLVHTKVPEACGRFDGLPYLEI